METGDIGNGESVPYDTDLGKMHANTNVQICTIAADDFQTRIQMKSLA